MATQPLVTGPADLTPAHRALFAAALAARPRALACDLDGTLAPIAATPTAVRLLPGASKLLAQARKSFDRVALVSGRDVASLWRIARVLGIRYVGDHGNVTWNAPNDPTAKAPSPALDARVAAALATFADLPVARQTTGLLIEPKVASAAFHYRAAPDPTAARAELLAALAPLAAAQGLRVIEGKMVIELQAPESRDKGDAIRDLLTRDGMRGLIYFGDDQTDIAAFRAAQAARSVGACATVAVAVAHREAPADLVAAADLVVAEPAAVLSLIAWLVAGAP